MDVRLSGVTSRKARPIVVEIELEGHLSEELLAGKLAEAATSLVLGVRRVVVLVNCSKMTDYDSQARQLFVEWNRRHRQKISKLAIVVNKPLWMMVISAMSLATKQEMRGFRDAQEARKWLGGGS